VLSPPQLLLLLLQAFSSEAVLDLQAMELPAHHLSLIIRVITIRIPQAAPSSTSSSSGQVVCWRVSKGAQLVQLLHSTANHGVHISTMSSLQPAAGYKADSGMITPAKLQVQHAMMVLLGWQSCQLHP
jgi:hypothetical protein